jgi:lysozyme
MSYLDILKAQLKIDEGVKNKPYKDTVGKLTIGCGRNLDDVGLRDSEIDFMLDNDIASAEKDARILVRAFDQLNDVRKAVVLNMVFNMGFSVFSQFRQTIAAINSGDYTKAAANMLDSSWAQQVGARAQRLAEQMAKGE